VKLNRNDRNNDRNDDRSIERSDGRSNSRAKDPIVLNRRTSKVQKLHQSVDQPIGINSNPIE